MNTENDNSNPPPIPTGAGKTREEPAHPRLWWTVSFSLTIILALTLSALWYAESQSPPENIQLVDQAMVNAFLADTRQTDAVTVPTGIFLQSLEFLSITNVHMSGYIWQRRTDGVHDAVSEGFILPDLVSSIFAPREEYRVRAGDQQVIGWYFEGVFRQTFDFSDYPFDHKFVWLRIWPKDFDGNVVLVPDFAAYPCPAQPESSCTGLDDSFGIDEMIVLGEFERKYTYFDYLLSSYNSNFGIDSYAGQTGFPELRYNVVIRRLVEDAFTIYIVPIFAVAALAYMTLLLATHKERLASRFGFNTFQALAVLSALFFVLIISQGQIRREFPGSGFIYIEWFYFVMYIALLAVAFNAYMTRSPNLSKWLIIRYGDNIIAKVSYWPVLIGTLVVITALSI